jgi:hypothetical protein
VIGAAYLVLICLVPEVLFSQAGVPFYLGGTSLLIVVNVTMDTVAQIQSHLIAHQYGDLIKKAKLKTTRRRYKPATTGRAPQMLTSSFLVRRVRVREPKLSASRAIAE